MGKGCRRVGAMTIKERFMRGCTTSVCEDTIRYIFEIKVIIALLFFEKDKMRSNAKIKKHQPFKVDAHIKKLFEAIKLARPAME
jgi:hypothetical protein